MFCVSVKELWTFKPFSNKNIQKLKNVSILLSKSMLKKTNWWGIVAADIRFSESKCNLSFFIHRSTNFKHSQVRSKCLWIRDFITIRLLLLGGSFLFCFVFCFVIKSNLFYSSWQSYFLHQIIWEYFKLFISLQDRKRKKWKGMQEWG